MSKESKDPQRPQYHFLSPENWMNDPNGLIQWKGEYHMFYQYNPHGAYHNNIHWGHARSRDLLHWEHLPIALTPDEDGYDADGCWSGCAVDKDGVPTLLYTAVSPQTVCLAEGSHDLLTWKKFPRPVLESAPPEVVVENEGDFRDPFVWRDATGWKMLMGSKLKDKGGLILLYESTDLLDWSRGEVLLRGDIKQVEPFWTGMMWECPNLLDFGEKQLVLISAQSDPIDPIYVFYFSGQLSGSEFLVESQQILTPASEFYAPQIMHSDDGRMIMFGWVSEGRTEGQAIEAGWNGMMSLPLECSLGERGKLIVSPVRELKNLRGKQHVFRDIEPDGLLPGVGGDALEIIAEFEPLGAEEFGLTLRCSPDGEEQTRIVCRDGQVFIDRDHSSLDREVNRDRYCVPLNTNEKVKLRVFLDHSCIEVFINDQDYLVSRVYPQRDDSLGVGLFASGETLGRRVDIWEMDSIWED